VASIQIARSDQQIAACFDVMHQLRTHVSQAEFLPKVRQQQAGGYELAYLESNGQVLAAAGYRVIDNLASGRMLYVDDLVTDTNRRSEGHGRALLQWLIDRAKAEKCRFLELDSGVQRFDAHRFYLTNRMLITSHHFKLKL
jgi:GNAT superfamily N-acetyltransferase